MKNDRQAAAVAGTLEAERGSCPGGSGLSGFARSGTNEGALSTVLLRVGAGILFVTASLKLLQFPSMPISQRPDPVLAFLTEREALILATVFEAAVASYLLKATSSLGAGLALLYFATITTLYQVGLLFIGDPPCGCLGVANDWLPASVSKGITRLVLVLFWLGTVRLLWCHRASFRARATGLGQPAKGALAAIVLAFSVGSSASASAIRLDGYVTTMIRSGPTPIEQRQDFTAWIEGDTFRIDVPSPAPNPRFTTGGPCTNTTYVTKTTFAGFGRCLGLETIPVSIYDPQYPWMLGNCGATVNSAVWVALRLKDLFPAAESRHRFAPPWTTAGEPLGLVTEAEYEWTDGGFDAQLLVSRRLLDAWAKSPLRAPGLAVDKQAQAVFARELVGLRDGWLAGTIHMRSFTNLQGVEIPRRVEFLQFVPREQVKGNAREQPHVSFTVRFTAIAPATNRLDVLPLTSQVVHVADHRLRDPDLGVGAGQFSTNLLETFDVSPAAAADFADKVQHALQKARAATMRKVFTGLILGTLVLAPAGFALYVRFKHIQKS